MEQVYSEQLSMSCCGLNPPKYQQKESRHPLKFSNTEIEDLRRKFQKVSSGSEFIDLNAFRRNMGVLGIQSASQFASRLFNSFDMNNDGKISFDDFIQYMEVLKCGTEDKKAFISFKLIVKRGSNKITKSDFKDFLNDFLLSWSSLTNIALTQEIRDRIDLFLSFVFTKVQAEQGVPDINAGYYRILYRDKDFAQSFQFITQGMANMFINDPSQQNNDDVHSVLFKVLTELRELNDTALAMNNAASFQFESNLQEESSPPVPQLTVRCASRNGLKSRVNIFKKSKMKEDATVVGSNSEPSGEWYEEKHTKTARAPQYSKSAIEKRLEYVTDKVKALIDETDQMYLHLRHRNDEQREKMQHRKQETVENVHKKDKQGNMVFFGDQSWNLVLNMMIGIQMAVRSVRGFQEMIYEEPKDFGLKYYFELIPRRFGNENETSMIYSFTDYAPNTFNHIRQAFNINNEEYIHSIGPNRLMGSLMMGQVNSMTTLTSQGKSGSFFYYTADGKYMLKTIRYREYSFLRSILKSYYEHLMKNPGSLITKFFGLHKLIQKNAKGEEINRSYFVIMANVFNTKQKVIERYDLKGSSYGRDTNNPDPAATKKDNDFLKRRPLYLKPEDRTSVLTALEADVRFFERHEIIDYSVLMGVIHKEEETLNNTSSQLFCNSSEFRQNYMRESQQLFSSQKKQSYIIGIIDILTLYDSRKKLQCFFKNLFLGDTVSAVPPREYANRFLEFMKQKVFPVAPQNCQHYVSVRRIESIQS